MFIWNKNVKIIKQETEKFTLNVIHKISDYRFYMISLKYGYCLLIWNECITCSRGAQWLSGRVLDSRPKGRGFEPHRRHCVVSLSKNINPSIVLVQPRKTRPFITERLLMGRKESNQTNKQTNNLFRGNFLKHILKLLKLTLYSIVTFFGAFEMQHIFKSIQNVTLNFLDFFLCYLKKENDVVI